MELDGDFDLSAAPSAGGALGVVPLLAAPAALVRNFLTFSLRS